MWPLSVVAGPADYTTIVSRRPAWPLQAVAAFADFYIFVHYDLVASVIVSSPTTSSTPTTADCTDTSLYVALRPATVQEASSASPSDAGAWFMMVPAPARLVLAIPARAFIPDEFPSLASSDRCLVFIGDNVWASTPSSTTASTASPTSSMRTRFWQTRSMPSSPLCAWF